MISGDDKVDKVRGWPLLCGIVTKLPSLQEAREGLEEGLLRFSVRLLFIGCVNVKEL